MTFQPLSLDDAVVQTFVDQWAHEAWKMAAVTALNRMFGSNHPLEEGGWSNSELRVSRAIGLSIERVMSHGAAHRPFSEDEQKELQKKRVNYQGEEIGVCHKLSLEQVLPALPPPEHGGSILTTDFVSEQTKGWLLNPGRSLLDDVGQDVPRLQAKIHVVDNEMDDIAAELVSRGVCDWVPLDSVVTFRKQRVLNGLFGVEKSGSVKSGRSILRLIMNLIPINSVMRQYVGAVKNLPSITAWMGVVLEGEQELRIWQSDMCNAFYLFRLPDVWKYFLSFNVIRKRPNQEGIMTDFALACCVLPMGWSSSVSIMQEISENLLKTRPLGLQGQLVRNKALPPWMTGIIAEAFQGNRSWWHVYLDNFAAGEIGNPDAQWKGGSLLHDLAEECWSLAGVLSSEKKKKRTETIAEELGAFVDGKNGWIGGSPLRLLGLIQATLNVLGNRSLSKKLIQVIAGRWIHVMQFRRPSMCTLNATWEFIGKTGLKSRETVLETRRELFSCLCLTPLLHTFLGTGISDIITASDASTTGGAVGLSSSLTPQGESYVNALINAMEYSGEIPVLVISLFNGIGGAFRTYDLLGLRPKGLIAFDTHGPANRVTSRAWPHCEIYLDVRFFSREFFRDVLVRFLGILEIHLWAGFPCVDLSSAKFGRKGLDGAASGLFYEVIRVRKIILEEIPNGIIYKEVIENVASMARDQCDRISNLVGRRPYFLDCCDAVPMHRPRLCWTTESLNGVMDDVYLQEEGPWMKVVAEATYPAQSSWMTPGSVWPGGETGTILPTAMKAIPRSRPPVGPAGIERCDWETLQRYEADEFRFPPYQYKQKFIFYSPSGKWRLITSDEKELLLGYGWQHTSMCFSASHIKQSKQKYVDERHSLLGDSFSIFSFIIPAVALCRQFMGRVRYSHLVQRMGMAPGFRSPIRTVAPLARCLQYGFESVGISQTVQQLNRFLLTRVNHTGSDVRIASGELLNPKAHPRQGVQRDWWNWQPSFSVKWHQKEHINILELRSIFLAVKYHVTHLNNAQFRIFHISDSYVCLSIISKGRTSSKALTRVLRQLNAFLLAHGIVLIVGHIDSLINPTDGASRSLESHLQAD